MITHVVAVVAMALLFVTFGLATRYRRCTGECGGCDASCPVAEALDDHV